MLKSLATLNWTAILAATAAYYVLGGIWFSPPLLGALHHEALGFHPPEGWSPGAPAYWGPFAACLVASIGTALVSRATGRRTPTEGLELGLIVWLAYAAGGAAMEATAPGMAMPVMLFGILAGYHAVGLTIVAVIVTRWRKG
jgi:hypothetical protein